VDGRGRASRPPAAAASTDWAGLLGRDQHGFRKAAPGWADDAVRPHLAAHAFLLGGFTAFYRLGSFSRLTLAWRVFGRARVDGEIGRIRAVLAGWGYRLGRDNDQLLPMVACQVFLLNRSPHSPGGAEYRIVRTGPPRAPTARRAEEHGARHAAGRR
jgi:hypothetical protein